ncbi:proline--tRNA ligase-like protein [Carex littledalei]|uniref:proline--tRNA ligase n=1 Tax=Carex littledalei TaxID=544730 RepID=A0A833QKT2_9POAL|nr:proline--tRNA ligase-like protein [Carex littledalei]
MLLAVRRLRSLSLLYPTFSPRRRLPPLFGVRGKVSISPSLPEFAGKISTSPSLPEFAVTPRSVDFNAWFQDVIAKAELADDGPVKGTMIYRPYAYKIWEAIQKYLDVKFEKIGHRNLYLPQLIPNKFIEKEASHIEGFSPELAIVTIGGGKELEEKLVLRPTSETIVNYAFDRWIRSYRDLPCMINQWVNVTRWEKRTKPFLRTLEFLWQEGHTAHATFEEAEKMALQMINLYKDFAYEQIALPVIAGRKSKAETFAGATCTYTIEAMMGDKRALQSGTSHNLGQNFSRAFETRFMKENGDMQHVWQTSSAVSTRLIGGIIMTHGDDTGLMLPPRIAPIQVVIVPIWNKSDEETSVLEAATTVHNTLTEAGIRVELDKSNQETPGWKFNFWEMKGVPLRLEIGPRDVTNKSVVVSRRTVPGKVGKEFGVSMEASTLVNYVKSRLEEIQDVLLQRAISFRDSNIVDVSSYGELKEAIAEGKWARGPWSASAAEELKVKKETSATLRCFPFEQPEGDKKCFMTGKPAEEVAIFAKSY